MDYRGISWPIGPRATPTVDGDRVYVAGADGKLFCLDVKTGAIIWKKDYVKDYGADRRKWAFDWGFASAPLVDGDRLIALVGGQPDAKVVAFDKMTGKEIWRALSSTTELGVAQPIIITAGGARQLIIWYPGAVASLDPETGKTYWEQPYKVGGVDDRRHSRAARIAAVLHDVLRRADDAHARRQEAGRHGAVEGQERQRDPDRRPARGDRHAGRSSATTSTASAATASSAA